MGTFLYYLFQSTLCLTVLCVLFRCFFRADTLFRANRCVLVGGMMVCLLLPMFPLQLTQEVGWGEPLAPVRELLMAETMDETPQAMKETLPIADNEAMMSTEKVNHPTGISLSRQLLLIYIIGTCATLLFFLLSTFRMLRLIHRYPARRDVEGTRVVLCSEPVRSFSWGNTIVLSQTDADDKADIVLLHERMHLHYHHTLDLLLMQALLVLHWFNPAAWLLMKYLREVHEFEADNGVINQGIDATQYQLLLVRKCVGTRLYSMTNTFRSSKLKNRITMMLKKRTNPRAHLKPLLFVPVAALAMAAFAQQKVNEPVVAKASPTEYVTQSDTTSKEKVSPVTLIIYQEGKPAKTFTNFTLKELEEELGMMVMTDSGEPCQISVSLKIDPDTKMGAITDVKEVLRNAYLRKKNQASSND